jgi:hypothetical protein
LTAASPCRSRRRRAVAARVRNDRSAPVADDRERQARLSTSLALSVMGSGVSSPVGRGPGCRPPAER